VSYPVTFEADYTEQRDRLATFFRLILVIPLALWLYLYLFAATIAMVIAWFAIVLDARYPQWLYDMVAAYIRFLARVTAYALLLSDTYPPFNGLDDPAYPGSSPSLHYPVRVRFAGPLERYSRLKTLLRIILEIPILILRYVILALLEIGAIAAWFVIILTSKMPRGLFDLIVLANSYIVRSEAYLFLLTETYPPLQDTHTRTASASGPSAFEPPAVT